MSPWCVKVPVREGESVRRQLSEEGLIDRGWRIGREGDHLLIPVVSETIGMEVVERDLVPIEQRERDYRSLLSLDEGLMDLLPTSFDIIGDVAIIRLPEGLIPHAEEVGEALLRTFPRLRAVALDRGVRGELRVRDLEIVAGEGPLETVHREFGVRMVVDPTQVYFNPRLAGERHRIATDVREGEVIIDMFTGLGPFPLVISRHARPATVYAIDLNPDAIDLLRRNMEMNRLEGIVPILGDARDAMADLPMADRIIMNLPHSAEDFLPDALARLREGGVIHLYMICEREELPDRMEALIDEAHSEGCVMEALARELKTYSPTMSVYAMDLRLIKRLSPVSG